jgi:glucose/arabinose dehydrogenase
VNWHWSLRCPVRVDYIYGVPWKAAAVVGVAAVLATACGSGGAAGVGSIGAGLRGPTDLQATVYARGLTHVSALTLDARGRLWATASGSAAHATDGVYLVARAGASPVKVVSGLTAPLGIVWVGERLFVSSLGRVTAYSGFDGSHFRHQAVVLNGPVAGGENNNLVLAPNGRLVMGISASCDHCLPTSKWSGSVVSFRLDGSDLRLVARRVRAAYGLAYLPGTNTLFATMNQRDDLGVRTPGDWLAVVRAGQNWGFPTCYGQATAACANKPKPVAVLDAHAAAGGVALVSAQLGDRYRLSALVAEWQLGVVERVPLHMTSGTYNGKAGTLLTGFQNPLPVLATGNAVLIGDWGTGIVYRIASA